MSFVLFLYCKINFEKCTVISVCTTMKKSNLPDMILPQKIYCITVLKQDLCLIFSFLLISDINKAIIVYDNTHLRTVLHCRWYTGEGVREDDGPCSPRLHILHQ